MKQKMFVALSLVACLTFAVVGCQATRAGYESARYTVVRSDGQFELRDYPELTVVETSLSPVGEEDDGSFRRLFRFITGENEARQKIAMTTPVLMSGGGSDRSMAFVMPEKVQAVGVPQPIEDSLTVREHPSARYAVMRYSGGRNGNHEAESLEGLRNWMAAEGLGSTSPPVYGYFDPPWTPSFLRRNEVMLEVSRSTHQVGSWVP